MSVSELSRVDALLAHDWADDWDSLPDAPELVPAEHARRLNELAAIVTGEYGQIRRTRAEAFEHARRCGEALLEARPLCPRDEWEQWLAQTGLHVTTARQYARIAEHWDRLSELGVEGIEDAKIALIEEGLSQRARLTRAARVEIVKHAAEQGVAAAAERFGVAQSSVREWRRGNHLPADPQPRQRQRRSREQIRRDEIRLFKRRLTAKGKAASELYAAVERLQDLLGQAREEETDPQSLAAYRRATSLYHEMRDEIVRAVTGRGDR